MVTVTFNYFEINLSVQLQLQLQTKGSQVLGLKQHFACRLFIRRRGGIRHKSNFNPKFPKYLDFPSTLLPVIFSFEDGE